jgi:hypothetical protein
MELRKNGDHPFLHPLNIIQILKDSKVNDEVTFAAALIHDLIEERVDLHKQNLKIQDRAIRVRELDKYEKIVERNLHDGIMRTCEQHSIDPKKGIEVLNIVKVLTRHKRDFYYKSIAQIFKLEDERLKEKAIQVKLADRTHNILTIQTFDNDQRTYACFKNLFILNNVKRYILQKYGKGMGTTRDHKPTEILFKRCAKATYEAFLTIGHRCLAKGIGDIKEMIQLAFKKHAMQEGLVDHVTKPKRSELHLTRLFHGVVLKYDCRLHHEWDKFEKRVQDEINYCRKFFADYNFSDEQLHAILHYKDAYSLKEVVAYVTYDESYVLERFLVSNLNNRGRLSKKG